ncbi:MAG: hypothetical protein P8Y70_06710 [Candidatus Lokiarchaeota archaeon]
MSKFERYNKNEQYIYPHKHCKKCGDMIKEAYTYCPNCYQELKNRESKKGIFNKVKNLFKRNKN